MSAETFAQNLKSALIGKWLIGREEPRRNPLIVGMEVRVRSNPHPAGCWPVDLDHRRIGELISGECKPPTPAEITAIAAALGCPVERLTVSREELEAELERLRAWRSSMIDAFEEAFTHDDYYGFDILRDAYNKLESEAQP